MASLYSSVFTPHIIKVTSFCIVEALTQIVLMKTDRVLCIYSLIA